MNRRALSVELSTTIHLSTRAAGLRRLLEVKFYRPRRIHPDRPAIEASILAELEAAVAEALAARRRAR